MIYSTQYNKYIYNTNYNTIIHINLQYTTQLQYNTLQYNRMQNIVYSSICSTNNTICIQHNAEQYTYNENVSKSRWLHAVGWRTCPGKSKMRYLSLSGASFCLSQSRFFSRYSMQYMRLPLGPRFRWVITSFTVIRSEMFTSHLKTELSFENKIHETYKAY